MPNGSLFGCSRFFDEDMVREQLALGGLHQFARQFGRCLNRRRKYGIGRCGPS